MNDVILDSDDSVIDYELEYANKLIEALKSAIGPDDIFGIDVANIKDILIKLFNDADTAKSFGKATPLPVVKMPEEKTDDVDDQTPAQEDGEKTEDYERLIAYIENAEEADPLLLSISEDEFPEEYLLSGEQKSKAVKKAKDKLLLLRSNGGVDYITDDEVDDELESDPTINTGSQASYKDSKYKNSEAFLRMDTSSIRGEITTYYTVEGLHNGTAIEYSGGTEGEVNTHKWLVAHEVQAFLDSGALAELERDAVAHGETLKIHFLANPHYTSNNAEENPFAYLSPGQTVPYYNILYAVEMTDDRKELLADYYDKTDGVLKGDSFIKIDTPNGTREFQVIGVQNTYNKNDVKKDARA